MTADGTAAAAASAAASVVSATTTAATSNGRGGYRGNGPGLPKRLAGLSLHARAVLRRRRRRRIACGRSRRCATVTIGPLPGRDNGPKSYARATNLLAFLDDAPVCLRRFLRTGGPLRDHRRRRCGCCRGGAITIRGAANGHRFPVVSTAGGGHARGAGPGGGVFLSIRRGWS